MKQRKTLGILISILIFLVFIWVMLFIMNKRQEKINLTYEYILSNAYLSDEEMDFFQELYKNKDQYSNSEFINQQEIRFGKIFYSKYISNTKDTEKLGVTIKEKQGELVISIPFPNNYYTKTMEFLFHLDTSGDLTKWVKFSSFGQDFIFYNQNNYLIYKLKDTNKEFKTLKNSFF